MICSAIKEHGDNGTSRDTLRGLPQLRSFGIGPLPFIPMLEYVTSPVLAIGTAALLYIPFFLVKCCLMMG
jgi:hypothetical protein